MDILKSEVASSSEGKVLHVYDWSAYHIDQLLRHKINGAWSQ